MGPVFLALAAVACVASAGLAWAQARRAATASGADLEKLAAALKRLPEGKRLEELQRRSQAETWEHDLAAEALAVPVARRVAVVNLSLADAEHLLTRGAEWPRGGLRIALVTAILFAVVSYLSGQGVTWSLGILAVGGAAALVCVEAGRSARRSVARQRAAIDRLVAVVFGEAPLASAGPADRSPTPRRRRRG
jgi:Flp pilus assembly protein TadB